jgi:hypothetical protein
MKTPKTTPKTCQRCKQEFVSERVRAFCSRKCYFAEWKQANPGKGKEYTAKWAAANPEKAKAIRANRRKQNNKGKERASLSHTERKIRPGDDSLRAQELRAALFWGSR